MNQKSPPKARTLSAVWGRARARPFWLPNRPRACRQTPWQIRASQRTLKPSCKRGRR